MAKPQQKKTGKELVKWDEELANLAKESTAGMHIPTAKFISIRGGKMTFGGADVPDNELRAVVLGWVYENQLYEGRFNPDEKQSPACYAFGKDVEEMAPHENVEQPYNDKCSTCPMNEWESADNGKGKACKNVIRLALIAESDLEDLEAAEVAYMKIPVTSTKNFIVYAAKTLSATLKRPFWSVVTNIAVTSDDHPRVTFELAEKIEDTDLFPELKEASIGVEEGIGFPYPKVSEEDKPKPKAKGKAKPQKFARR